MHLGHLPSEASLKIRALHLEGRPRANLDAADSLALAGHRPPFQTLSLGPRNASECCGQQQKTESKGSQFVIRAHARSFQISIR